MPADHHAIEEQYRYIKTIAARKVRISVHVDDIDCGQCHRGPKRGKIGEHVFAQLALAPMHDGQARQAAAGIKTRRCQCPGGATDNAGSDLVTDEAMNRTVAGGTSPTAVTLCPSITVENADEEPTLATPATGC